MSKVSLAGNASGTGIFTIASPNSNTDRTLTLPDNTGTVVTTGSTAGVSQAMLASNVAGNGPLLITGSAPGISVPNVTTTVFTTYNASSVDTAGAFNVSNGRFTPQVAGYYLILASVGFDSNGVSGSSISAQILKNNGVVLYSGFGSSTTIYPRLQVVSMVPMNGTTDYVTVGAYQNGGSTVSSVYASMQAVLIRAA
jgi:hypothetical protein